MSGSIQSYVEVSISEFDDATVLRQAARILTERAESGPLETDAERAVERIAVMLGLFPGSLPPASTAALQGAFWS